MGAWLAGDPKGKDGKGAKSAPNSRGPSPTPADGLGKGKGKGKGKKGAAEPEPVAMEAEEAEGAGAAEEGKEEGKGGKGGKGKGKEKKEKGIEPTTKEINVKLAELEEQALYGCKVRPELTLMLTTILILTL